ncbi:MAG: DNA-directed RNA polymerase subunit beta' [Ruminiclostridium sp.]|nr:DNA-directed RNA polymerase subunit beta' [Ruminiclostridium sp.]
MEFNTFEAMQIGLASPEKIREWSYGEVKKPETINYRTLKPERDGLFCEKIFGPQKDWECHCGKYKRIRYKGIVCDRCGVEVTKAKVRRERMGHIELAAPVSHIWYFKGIPSRMGLLLDISPHILEKVLYFAQYIVIDPGKTELNKKDPLTEKEYMAYYEKYGDRFRAGMGAEAIKELLSEIDIEKLSEELKEELQTAQGQKKVKIAKRLEVVESFRKSNNRPEWMILDCVPVIPPEIRPMVQLDGGRFATSDLNDLYRRVINRNNRLKRLLELGAPNIIVRNEKRMLQEAVDALIDNGRRGRPVTGPGNRALKSLSDMLKGKQGRFRQNLLGKRVDYSGRSVIVVGPALKIYQCGLPKEMALELFKPFVMKRLVENGSAHNIKSAKRMVERARTEVWDVLESVIKEHPVLLNRAPTLHRLGIQAFEPILVEGRAIRLHPLVCTAFNADFDGDQMAVHVPLSPEAQAEARFLMLSANNLLKPQDGRPVTVPTQDMVLGSYYLTLVKPKEVKITDAGDSELEAGKIYKYYDAVYAKNLELEAQGKKMIEFSEDGVGTFPGEIGEGKSFSSVNEAMMAYDCGDVGLHAPIKVRVNKEIDGIVQSKIIEVTVGRLIFNEVVPQDLGFVDRSNPENEFQPEIAFLADKKALGKIVDACIKVHGTTKTAEVLDSIKELGYKFSTRGAITISVSDMEIPGSKAERLSEAEDEVEKITKLYRKGLITDEERYRKVIETWQGANDRITKALMDNLDKYNPIYMMATSGARGSINQIRQLAGMRGLMANTQGRTVEIPIRASCREGLNILEYFISTHGARKGLADTALRTADSGYLTRRLVDVSQDVIIREIDCKTHDGINVSEIVEGKDVIEPLEERLIGRVNCDDIVHPETGEVIIPENTLMNKEMAARVVDAGIKQVKIRSVLNCHAKVGVCAHCYGANLASRGELVNIGEAVGIIAAQSIGEPGTQLTMRTFHTGGVAGDDITQGLPRVEELFEARKPKGLAIVTDIAGTVTVNKTKSKTEVMVADSEGMAQTYLIPYGSTLKVTDGDVVEAGDELTTGSINPHDILRIKNLRAVQEYLVKEVQKVYRQQAVDIADKHIEVIVRQMMRKVRIEESGDSNYLVGETEDRIKFGELVEQYKAEGKNPPVGEELLLGITKAALATDSFLSAASFQETTRVLTDAAIKGKVDPLIGLKENVIIGKLIPAGTGVPMYHDIDVETAGSDYSDILADMVENMNASGIK